MQINLKKAAELAAATLRAAEEFPIPNVVLVVTAYDDRALSAIYETARTDLWEALRQREALEDAAYALRKEIGIANSAAGIPTLLTERQRLKARAAATARFLAIAARASGEERLQTVQRRFDMFREQRESQIKGTSSAINALALSREESANVRIVTAADIVVARERLMQIECELRENIDQVAALNLTRHITLAQHLVAVLRTHKLL